MSKIIDRAGKRYGRLIVLNISLVRSGRALRWDCVCDCGTLLNVPGQRLRESKTTSCGCYHRDMMKKHGGESSFRHGQSNNKLYRAWDGMVRRCKNPFDKRYFNYGGRGITVTDEWLQFIPFAEHVGQPPSKKHTLDRIDNNKGYEPGNVRWATMKEQNNNKRGNHQLVYNGVSRNITQWAEYLGVRRCLIASRIQAGWDIAKTLTTPVELKYSHPRIGI